jgi:hypothetical protein
VEFAGASSIASLDPRGSLVAAMASGLSSALSIPPPTVPVSVGPQPPQHCFSFARTGSLHNAGSLGKGLALLPDPARLDAPLWGGLGRGAGGMKVRKSCRMVIDDKGEGATGGAMVSHVAGLASGLGDRKGGGNGYEFKYLLELCGKNSRVCYF